MAARCTKHCQYHRYRHTPKPSQNSITPTCNQKNGSKRRHHYHTNNFSNSSCATSHRMGLLMEVIPKKSLPTTPEELTAGFSFERAIDFIKVAKTLMICPASLQTRLSIQCSIFAGISLKYIWKNRIQTSQWVSCRMLSLPIFISIELLLWWRWILHTMFVQKHCNMFVKHHLAIWVAFAHLQVFKCCRLFCQTNIPQPQWKLNTPSSPGSARSLAVKPRRSIANTFLLRASWILYFLYLGGYDTFGVPNIRG